MSNGTDPLLKAIARGDPNCPDGANLARLGELARRASAPAGRDLRDRVRAALAAADGADADDGAGIDAMVDGTATDPALARLGGLVRGIAPRKVDLRDRVRRSIAPASLRISPQQAAATGRRWRIIAAIAAVHVAAILLITAIAGQHAGQGDGTGTATAPDRTIATKEVRADSWAELRDKHGDLLAPRRDAGIREVARADAGLSATAPAVARMSAWLIAHQDPASGRIATTATGERAIAIQSLAALALLGEGLGDQTRLDHARRALGPVAAAMAGTEQLGPQALGAASLALVEGALVTGDPELRLQAQAGLWRLARELPGRPGEGGLAGLGWLALETAETAGLATPPKAVDAARARIALPEPSDAAGPGRLGLTAFAGMVLGQRQQAAPLIARLATTVPGRDANGCIDSLSWFLCGLAVNAEGGQAWRGWAEGLVRTVPPLVVADGPATGHVPAAAVRFAEGADGDVLATSATLLALQAPYRYAALSR